MATEEQKKIASNWYTPQEIHEALTNRRRCLLSDFGPAPADVQSIEFAEWLAIHLQRAMLKGMQIANNSR